MGVNERRAITVGRHDFGEVLWDGVLEQRWLKGVSAETVMVQRPVQDGIPQEALWHELVSTNICASGRQGSGRDAEAISVEKVSTSSSLRLIQSESHAMQKLGRRLEIWDWRSVSSSLNPMSLVEQGTARQPQSQAWRVPEGCRVTLAFCGVLTTQGH